MRQKETWGARLKRESLGMLLEIGLVIMMMAIALVIAVAATLGHY